VIDRGGELPLCRLQHSATGEAAAASRFLGSYVLVVPRKESPSVDFLACRLALLPENAPLVDFCGSPGDVTSPSERTECECRRSRGRSATLRPYVLVAADTEAAKISCGRELAKVSFQVVPAWSAAVRIS